MESDYTARTRDRLLDSHDASTDDQDGREKQLREVRARYPHACVFFDDELQDIVVDLSSGRGR
jgi:hypothetical protein